MTDYPQIDLTPRDTPSTPRAVAILLLKPNFSSAFSPAPVIAVAQLRYCFASGCVWGQENQALVNGSAPFVMSFPSYGTRPPVLMCTA